MQSHYYCASAYLALSDFHSSLLFTNHVVAVCPSHTPSHSIRVECKRRLGLWKEVLKDSIKILKLDKCNSGAWCCRAESLMHLGRLAEAEVSASQAINCDKDNRFAYQIRGEARYQQKKYKSATFDFHSFGELDRTHRGAQQAAPALPIWKTTRDRLW